MSNHSDNIDQLSYKGEIDINSSKTWGMITLKGDLGSDSFTKIITDCFKISFPNARGVSATNNSRVIWMAPDELLLLVRPDEVTKYITSLEKDLKGQHYLVADVSDARALFNLKGEGVYDVLAKGTPTDMSNFEINQVSRSRIGQLSAAFWMINTDEIEIICFRSVSDYLFDWLKTASVPNSLPRYFK